MANARWDFLTSWSFGRKLIFERKGWNIGRSKRFVGIVYFGVILMAMTTITTMDMTYQLGRRLITMALFFLILNEWNNGMIPKS
jgi:hypothetical protein